MSQLKICKKLFVFDWDGTIIDSMQTKYNNFSNLLCNMINEVSPSTVCIEEVLDIYKTFSGHSRRFIFDETLSNCGCKGKVDYPAFTSALAKTNINDLKDAMLFEDSVRLLDKLHLLNIPFCISSSSPVTELTRIVSAKQRDGVLLAPDHILGSKDGFRKGFDHLSFLRQQYQNLSFEDIVFFGDEIMDYKLNSVVAGVTVYLIDRESRFTEEAIPTIRSFDCLEIEG